MIGNQEFYNVDLELKSRRSLVALADEFERMKAFILRNHWYSGRYYLNLETDGCSDKIDATIKGLAKLVEDLSPQGKTLWNSCTVRDFNIGVACSGTRSTGYLRLKAESLAIIAKLDATVAVTVYPKRSLQRTEPSHSESHD